MLTKQDILYYLKDFYHVPKDKIIILCGASLVMQGIIKETKDIDIAIPKEYNDKKIIEYLENILN